MKWVQSMSNSKRVANILQTIQTLDLDGLIELSDRLASDAIDKPKSTTGQFALTVASKVALNPDSSWGRFIADVMGALTKHRKGRRANDEFNKRIAELSASLSDGQIARRTGKTAEAVRSARRRMNIKKTPRS
jgi:hypothetical protein